MDMTFDEAEWNGRALAWAKSRPDFDYMQDNAWKDLLDSEFTQELTQELKPVQSNLFPLFTEYAPATDIQQVLETPPLQPFHIEPNHYVSTNTLERIQECIEAFFSHFKVSFEMTKLGTYTYKCVYINDNQSECKFWINLFTADGFIIEIQRISGDGFGFIDTVRAFRHWLQINEVISNPNEPPYKPLEAMKLSAGLPPTPAMFIDPELVKQTVQNMIQMASSLYFDVATEAITALADTSSQPDILEAIVSNLRTRELLYTRLSSEETHICYCILVIIRNIIIAYPEKKYQFVNLLPELIRTFQCRTLPQIWEKSAEILLLLEEPIEPTDMAAILEKLRSNPFPTLDGLAQKLEGL